MEPIKLIDNIDIVKCFYKTKPYLLEKVVFVKLYYFNRKIIGGILNKKHDIEFVGKNTRFLEDSIINKRLGKTKLLHYFETIQKSHFNDYVFLRGM